MTSKLELKKYNSRELIGKLNVQKHHSQRKPKSFSNLEKLPQINKN